MRGFTSLDVYFMVKELQTLIGGRIDKIQQFDEEIFLPVYVTSKGNKLLRIKSNKIWITKHKPEFEKLPHIAATLRKHISNQRIKEIKQIKSERIIEIIIGKEEDYKLYIELFGNGNIILEKQGKIICSKIERKWKDRQIRRGQKYEMPPVTENIFEITEAKLKQKLKKDIKQEDTEKQLALAGFGKDYAKEIFSRAKIIANSEIDFKKITRAIKEIFDSEILPKVYYENEKPNLATPIPFIHLKKKDISVTTFSLGIDLTEESPEKKDFFNEEKKKWESIIKIQEKQIKELEKKEQEERKKAEMIYTKYTEIKEILEKIKNKKISDNVKIDWKNKKAKIKFD